MRAAKHGMAEIVENSVSHAVSTGGGNKAPQRDADETPTNGYHLRCFAIQSFVNWRRSIRVISSKVKRIIVA
jgi:hypothetical protein